MELNYDRIAGEVLSLKQAGDKSFWITLSAKYGKSSDALRSWFERERRKRSAMETLLESDETSNEEFDDSGFHGEDDGEKSIIDYNAKTETKFNDNGHIKYISSNRLIKMSLEEEKSPSFVLKAHGFNSDEWIVVSIVNNYWQGMRKDDLGAATLYQSKITVKPKTENNQITFSDVEEFFKNFDGINVLPSLSHERKFISTNKALVVPITDPHFGNEEDGYSTEEKILNLLCEISNRLEVRPVDKIVVVGLGDMLHVDTEGGTTTSGTQVGERGTIYYYWEKALVSMLNLLSSLSKFAKVEYVAVSGNHDRVNGFTLSKALEYAMAKSGDDVEFDVSFSHRKYKVIGNSIFGFAHGDMPSKNQGHILQAEERKAFGNSKFAYLMMGHLHHISIKDEQNVITMTLPSVTETDYWHKQNGYVGSWRGTLCYVVDEEDGIVETWHIKA